MKLGKFDGEYVSTMKGDDNRDYITFRVTPAHGYVIKMITEKIKLLKKNLLTIEIKRYVNSRTNQQNKMLWALLEIMAGQLSGGRAGDTTAWDCYVDMLGKYGAKYEYVMVPERAVEMIQEQFRASKVIEYRENEKGKQAVIKCFYGSSKMDTKEFAQLLDGILDTLADMGLDDTTDLFYWNKQWDDWKEK